MMKSIAYIIPYFGKLPKNFPLWLLGCKCNPTVNWIILTDDKTIYDYPLNVKVIYTSYQNVVNRIKSHFDFEVLIDRPWRLSLFKPAYGEIFSEELQGYDFWGYCDIDLMWGNIRKFYTEDVLDHHDRVGFLGHSTLYRNNKENNARYKVIVPGEINYIDVFTGKSGYSFDENGMDAIFDYLHLPYYNKIVIADLEKYESGFVLGHFPKTENYKNAYQIFTWLDGTLIRNYFDGNEICKDEFLYVHFFCRPMKYVWKKLDSKNTFYIYPDVMTDKNIGVTINSIKKYGTRGAVAFFLNSLWVNRHKITVKRILINFRNLFNYLKK